MSEDEQSASDVDAHDDIKRLRLLLLAMYKLRPSERWPTDNHAFSRAVDKTTAEGNPFAKQFQVFTLGGVRHCFAFETMLHIARSDGSVRRIGDGIYLNVAPRTVAAMARDFATEEIDYAINLMCIFWEMVHGDPLRAVPTYAELVARYTQQAPDLDSKVKEAEGILRMVQEAPDPARALAVVLLGTRDGALDFAIESARAVVPGNQTLADCLRASKWLPGVPGRERS
jgi:hypothetical protein